MEVIGLYSRPLRQTVTCPSFHTILPSSLVIYSGRGLIDLPLRALG